MKRASQKLNKTILITIGLILLFGYAYASWIYTDSCVTHAVTLFWDRYHPAVVSNVVVTEGDASTFYLDISYFRSATSSADNMTAAVSIPDDWGNGCVTAFVNFYEPSTK